MHQGGEIVRRLREAVFPSLECSTKYTARIGLYGNSPAKRYEGKE